MTDPDREARARAIVRLYDFVDWRSPVRITVPGVGRRWACRLCIALDGLRGEDVARLPFTRELAALHVEQSHASTWAASN